LTANLAAEQKARATYEHLMDLTNDPDLLAPLSFLRQREIIHYARFKELYDEYVKKYYQPDFNQNC
ncbi:MAG: manganese catalase family protein, partial [Coprobacillus cateniformis]|uniref:manganese catalase family protein n=1 Tax=Coprobacillus cateniformis TaxID=100884 RepID=UPI003992412A